MGVVNQRNDHRDYSTVRSDVLIRVLFEAIMSSNLFGPRLSASLAVKQEKGKIHDRFAVAVIRRQSRPAAAAIAGRIPRECIEIKRICIT